VVVTAQPSSSGRRLPVRHVVLTRRRPPVHRMPSLWSALHHGRPTTAGLSYNARHFFSATVKGSCDA
jgi:hypothetical protein